MRAGNPLPEIFSLFIELMDIRNWQSDTLQGYLGTGSYFYNLPLFNLCLSSSGEEYCRLHWIQGFWWGWSPATEGAFDFVGLDFGLIGLDLGLGFEMVTMFSHVLLSPTLWIDCSASMGVQEVLYSVNRHMQPSCTTSRTLSSMMRYFYAHATHNQSCINIMDTAICLKPSGESQICSMIYAQSQEVRYFSKAVCFEVMWNLSSPLMLSEHISILHRILTGNALQAFFTFIFLNKAPSVLGNQPQECFFLFSPSDKDRAAYSAAWEASPSLHLLPC